VNYRHAFHAGNFADCMKHVLLLWLLRALARKDAGFCVLDTHAGAGRYDLGGTEAERTGEWRSGIGRLMADPSAMAEPGIAAFLEVVGRLGLYPGSPALIRALLRPQDRLICSELHPEEHAALRRLFRHDDRVAVHLRDGYEAMRAFLPPKERRGLVLIDPPYEKIDEFETLAASLREAWAKFPTGVYAAWYPIKHRTPVRAFHAAIVAAGIRDVVAAEMLLREPLEANRLNGCGLLIINPPWRFMEEAAPMLQALGAIMTDREPGSGGGLVRLAEE
jgi:23S rRNA (adenine2030-N6)-methyltransferase